MQLVVSLCLPYSVQSKHLHLPAQPPIHSESCHVCSLAYTCQFPPSILPFPPHSPLPSPLSPLHLLTLRARYSMLILPPHAHPFATMPTINQAGGSSSGAVSNPSYEETQAPGRPVPVPAARPSSMAPPPQVMMRPPGLGARYSGRRSSLSDV